MKGTPGVRDAGRETLKPLALRCLNQSHSPVLGCKGRQLNLIGKRLDLSSQITQIGINSSQSVWEIRCVKRRMQAGLLPKLTATNFECLP